MGKAKQLPVRHSVEIALMYQKCGIRRKKTVSTVPSILKSNHY